MKKALYIICLFFVSVLFAEEFSYGDFLYKINENDEVILTKCKITNGFVQIPSEINGKKVTTIENDIFKYGNYISSIEITVRALSSTVNFISYLSKKNPKIR